MIITDIIISLKAQCVTFYLFCGIHPSTYVSLMIPLSYNVRKQVLSHEQHITIYQFITCLQLPPPPTASHQTGYVVVDASEIADITPEERVAEFEKIITELKAQIKSSSDNAIHFKTLGDVKQAFV